MFKLLFHSLIGSFHKRLQTIFADLKTAVDVVDHFLSLSGNSFGHFRDVILRDTQRMLI